MATYDISTDALVIRAVPQGDHDRLLTLLCPDEGRITVIAKGARSLRNKLMSPCRAFVWGNFELHFKGDMAWVRDASVIKSFTALEQDIELMYLAQYISDVCCELSGQGEPAGELLPLALNTFHALCSEKYDRALVKAAFELRAAAISGYLPELTECIRCEKTEAPAFYLDVMGGGIVCSDCIASAPEIPEAEIPVDAYGTRSIIIPITAGVLAAMRYVVGAPLKRLLSFGITSEVDKKTFCRASETYILNHLERGFASLRLYHELSE
ncbi:MAG: DNA repair protein RecO [Clostridia bacterium]|nr:DNA repair protein RecO [Clostridia bacterium]